MIDKYELLIAFIQDALLSLIWISAGILFLYGYYEHGNSHFAALPCGLFGVGIGIYFIYEHFRTYGYDWRN